ncbi:MAG: DUF2155 domain-containing protein [Pseudomonadota bacterium]
MTYHNALSQAVRQKTLEPIITQDAEEADDSNNISQENLSDGNNDEASILQNNSVDDSDNIIANPEREFDNNIDEFGAGDVVSDVSSDDSSINNNRNSISDEDESLMMDNIPQLVEDENIEDNALDEPFLADEDKILDPELLKERRNFNFDKKIDDNIDLEAKLTDRALIRGLNKITARTLVMELNINQPVLFGNLEVTLEKCWKSSPEETPENIALLNIWEKKPNENKNSIFYGWMFSSSPGLSTLQHSFYDISVLECLE